MKPIGVRGLPRVMGTWLMQLIDPAEVMSRFLQAGGQWAVSRDTRNIHRYENMLASLTDPELGVACQQAVRGHVVESVDGRLPPRWQLPAWIVALLQRSAVNDLD